MSYTLNLVYIYIATSCNWLYYNSCNLLYLGWFDDSFDCFSIVFGVIVIDDDDDDDPIIKL